MDITRLYDDIIFLIFDKLFLQFKNDLIKNIRKNEMIIWKEYSDNLHLRRHSNAFSSSVEDAVKYTCKHSSFAGFILSCETIYLYFKRYQERPQFESELYIEEDYNGKFDKYINKLKLLILVPLKLIIFDYGCNYYCDLVMTETENDRINIDKSIKFNNRDSKMKINPGSYLILLKIYDKQKYIFCLSLFDFLENNTLFVSISINSDGKIRNIALDTQYIGFLIDIIDDEIGHINFPDENIKISTIKNFINYFNICYPAEEEVIFRFLSGKKEYHIYKKVLILLKKIVIKINNFYEKYEVPTVQLSNILNVDIDNQ